MSDRDNKKQENIHWSLVKGIVIGTLLIAFAIWFIGDATGNPLHELALIRNAEITTGTLVDSFEVEKAGSNDRVYFCDRGVYSYLAGGNSFKTFIDAPTGQLNELEEVEYLPNNPEISRVKGDGCQSITELLWRKVGLGGLMLIAFSSFGFIYLRNSIKEYRHKKKRLGMEN